MRIISKFHDYYDSVQKLGQDSRLIYDRKIVSNIVDPWPFPRVDMHGDRNFGVAGRIIGFCGKIYPVFRLATHNFGAKVDYISYAFTIGEVDKFIKENYKEREYEAWQMNGRRYGNRTRITKYWNWLSGKIKWEEVFQQTEKYQNNFSYLFGINRPIFMAKFLGRNAFSLYGQIEYNTSLSDWEFQRIFDPYTAYQEIAMFLGNIPEERKKIPTIDDLTMSQAKGFDKFSFRKDPKCS